MTSIEELIDSAVEAYEVSGDAMRWGPDLPPRAAPKEVRATLVVPAVPTVRLEAGSTYRVTCQLVFPPGLPPKILRWIRARLRLKGKPDPLKIDGAAYRRRSRARRRR